MRPAGWETLALSQFIGQDWELTNNVGSAIGLAGAAILKKTLVPDDNTLCRKQ